MSKDEDRPARVEDVHELASGMPHVVVVYGSGDNPVSGRTNVGGGRTN